MSFITCKIKHEGHSKQVFVNVDHVASAIYDEDERTLKLRMKDGSLTPVGPEVLLGGDEASDALKVIQEYS